MKRTILIFGLIFFIWSCSKKDSSKDEENLGLETESKPCVNGMAGIYPCNGYDLLARLPLSDFNATKGNDIWGWTDPETAKEYAIFGVDNGVVFVDITDTENAQYIGKLPTATTASTWRDVKVYKNYTFVVSEAENHGMQIFDLTKLRSVTNAPETFEADVHYKGFGNAHNIVINEDVGYAYVVGTQRDDAFLGGAHFINIQDPMNPIATGGYAASGYTHDAQVVTYMGPDTDYTGKEIFIGANENQVVVADVTDKLNPVEISTVLYPNIEYTHQGWFTENQKYFLLGDELDETKLGFKSRTLVFDFTDLDNPVLFHTYLGESSAIDHNGYVKGDLFFLANYTAGIRVLDISGINTKAIKEVGFFDTYPAHNNADFNGVWSVYPYFNSGKIVIGDINSGLFVVKKSD
ncbi:choice-of-anchor B family protein [uncultured Maribacter sp.]|uniref:choice-of-anchor B family protein n=1 Tax=uncultured Maribacter sp. TaxID=431308 RepID=UPI00262FDCFD|nr:choice-of-anchor B family protein [uncultured Maribacter sp.]